MCPIEDTGDLLRRSERKRKPVDYKIDIDNSAFELDYQPRKIDKGKGRMPSATNNNNNDGKFSQLSMQNEPKKRKNLSLSKSKRSSTHTHISIPEQSDREAAQFAIGQPILDIDGPRINEQEAQGQNMRGNQLGTYIRPIEGDVLDGSDLSDLEDSVMLISSNSITKSIPVKVNSLAMDGKTNDGTILSIDGEYDLGICDGRSCSDSDFEDMNKQARKNTKKAANLGQKQLTKKSKIYEKPVEIVRSSQDETEEATDEEQERKKVFVEVEVEIVKSSRHNTLPKSTIVDKKSLIEDVDKKQSVETSNKKCSNLDNRDQNGLNLGLKDHTKASSIVMSNKSASMSQGLPSEKVIRSEINPELTNNILLRNNSTTLDMRQSLDSSANNINIIQATPIPFRVGLSKRHKFKPLHPYLEAKR